MSERSLMKALSHVLIKIMAVYFFVWNLYYIGSDVASLTSMYLNPPADIVDFNSVLNIFNWALTLALTPVLMLIISILLWIFAKRISNAVTKGIEETTEFKFDYNILLNLVFIIVGIFIAVTAIPGLVSNIYSLIHNNINVVDISGKYIANIITEALKIIIGVLFVFGFKGLARFVKKLGTAGVYSLNNENTEIGEIDK